MLSYWLASTRVTPDSVRLYSSRWARIVLYTSGRFKQSTMYLSRQRWFSRRPWKWIFPALPNPHRATLIVLFLSVLRSIPLQRNTTLPVPSNCALSENVDNNYTVNNFVLLQPVCQTGPQPVLLWHGPSRKLHTVKVFIHIAGPGYLPTTCLFNLACKPV